MDYVTAIAGFPDIVGLVALVASIVGVGVMLQRMRGPNDQGFSS
jgi:hypothetical protein